MKILAVDYGEKRIGLAVRPRDSSFVFPRPYLPRVSNRVDIAAMIKFLNEESIDLVLLGAPYNMDGSKGEAMEKVLAFKKALEKKLRYSTKIDNPPEILLWDERLTTVDAQHILLEQDVSRKKRKEVVDSLAATLLLESYLQEKGVNNDRK